MTRRRRTLLFLGLSLLTTVDLSAANMDKSPDGLPVVRVAIGMRIEELRSGSTYPFGTVPTDTRGGELSAFQITRPYNLVFVDGDAKLRLMNIGGRRELTSITMKNGRVSDISITVQNGRTDLHEAIAQARDLRDWFADHGYVPGTHSSAFLILAKNGKEPTASIASFEQAEAAFLDPNAKLAEMVVFGLRRGGTNVGVSLWNARRMRAHQSKEFDDEANAKHEKAYMLTMFITEIGGAKETGQ